MVSNIPGWDEAKRRLAIFSALRASHKRLLGACKKLVSIVPDSVEYGDWPELQRAVEKADTAIAMAGKVSI